MYGVEIAILFAGFFNFLGLLLIAKAISRLERK
jgi:hypothetical protein